MNIGYSNRYYAGQLARYYYRKGLVGKCYRELIRSEFTYHNFGLFLTAWNAKLRQFVLTKYNM